MATIATELIESKRDERGRKITPRAEREALVQAYQAIRAGFLKDEWDLGAGSGNRDERCRRTVVEGDVKADPQARRVYSFCEPASFDARSVAGGVACCSQQRGATAARSRSSDHESGDQLQLPPQSGKALLAGAIPGQITRQCLDECGEREKLAH